MKGLYESRVNIKQGGKKNLTKKTINQICSALPSPEYSNHVGQITHTVRKAGRLVTYADSRSRLDMVFSMPSYYQSSGWPRSWTCLANDNRN